MDFLQTRFAKNPDVIARAVENETVLLHLDSGVYYKLNEVGRAVWDLLDGERDVAALVAAIMKDYDVSAETLTADLQQLFTELEREGLVRTEADR